VACCRPAKWRRRSHEEEGVMTIPINMERLGSELWDSVG
jgi:hypothetical protein